MNKEEKDLKEIREMLVKVLGDFFTPIILQALKKREDFLVENIVASTDSSLEEVKDLLKSIDRRLSIIENGFTGLKCQKGKKEEQDIKDRTKERKQNRAGILSEISNLARRSLKNQNNKGMTLMEIRKICADKGFDSYYSEFEKFNKAVGNALLNDKKIYYNKAKKKYFLKE